MRIRVCTYSGSPTRLLWGFEEVRKAKMQCPGCSAVQIEGVTIMNACKVRAGAKHASGVQRERQILPVPPELQQAGGVKLKGSFQR